MNLNLCHMANVNVFFDHHLHRYINELNKLNEAINMTKTVVVIVYKNQTKKKWWWWRNDHDDHHVLCRFEHTRKKTLTLTMIGRESKSNLKFYTYYHHVFMMMIIYHNGDVDANWWHHVCTVYTHTYMCVYG